MNAKDMDEEFGAKFGKEFGVKFGVNEKRRHHRRTKHKKHVLWKTGLSAC